MMSDTVKLVDFDLRRWYSNRCLGRTFVFAAQQGTLEEACFRILCSRIGLKLVTKTGNKTEVEIVKQPRDEDQFSNGAKPSVVEELVKMMVGQLNPTASSRMPKNTEIRQVPDGVFAFRAETALDYCEVILMLGGYGEEKATKLCKGVLDSITPERYKTLLYDSPGMSAAMGAGNGDTGYLNNTCRKAAMLMDYVSKMLEAVSPPEKGLEEALGLNPWNPRNMITDMEFLRPKIVKGGLNLLPWIRYPRVSEKAQEFQKGMFELSKEQLKDAFSDTRHIYNYLSNKTVERIDEQYIAR